MPPFTFIPRGYLHFDAPVRRTTAEEIATDPARVARHSFYPFITYDITTVKIRKRQDGGIERMEPKIRPIAYAAHKDAHIFGYYSAILEELYEACMRERGLHRIVIAFRSLDRQRNIHFANETFEHIIARGNCAVLATDITGFFDNLDHAHLKAAWGQLQGVARLPEDHFSVFKAITNFASVDREQLFERLHLNPERPRADSRRRLCSPEVYRNKVHGYNLCRTNRTGRGIPQGSPISAALSNLYMLEFDTAVQEYVAARNGLYRRYCDDILAVLPTPAARQEVAEFIQGQLEILRLEANPQKTESIDFIQQGDHLVANRPLQYLGFTFDGRHKRIRPASVARYYKKMRAGVLRAKLVRDRLDRHSPSPGSSPLRRKQLNLRYSYLGRHNFLSYAFDAARIMQDAGIKKQVKAHWKRLNAEMDESQS